MVKDITRELSEMDIPIGRPSIISRGSPEGVLFCSDIANLT